MNMINENGLRVRLIRSPIGCKPKHRRTIAALGLRRVGQNVHHVASPEIIGMIKQVSYLVCVQSSSEVES